MVNEYRISKSFIYQLRKNNKPKTVDNFNISARDIYLLRKELETLRQTVNIYEKTQCVKSNPFFLINYTDFGFRSKLHDLHIEQSFSSAGTPYDNAVMEAFFSCLKREQLYVNEINNFDDLLYHVEYYITYYNNLQPHQTLKYKTPAQSHADAHS